MARQRSKRWLGLVLAATVAAGGCKTFSANLTAVDVSPFDKNDPHGDRPATIEISTPQVYSRESLINDRRDEQRYLEGLLEASSRIDFPAELARDLSSISALALDLGLAFDPAKALEFDAAKRKLDLEAERDELKLRQEIEELEARTELRGIERDIELTQLRIELEKLEAELAALRDESKDAGGDGGGGAGGGGDDGGGGGGDGNGGDGGSDQAGGASTTLPTLTPPASRMKELQESIDGFLDRLKVRSDRPRRVDTAPDPREDFRTRQAYRQDLRAALAEARLDDVHDQHGRALYRLQFQAMVAPGENTRKWGVAQLVLEAPDVGVMDYFPGLYRTWLGHVTYRLNQLESSRQGEIPNPLYRSLAAAGAFSLRNVYYDPHDNGDSIFEPCDSAQSEAEAALLGCESFLVAMPTGFPLGESALFPLVKSTALRLFTERALARLPDKAAPGSVLELPECRLGPSPQGSALDLMSDTLTGVVAMGEIIARQLKRRPEAESQPLRSLLIEYDKARQRVDLEAENPGTDTVNQRRLVASILALGKTLEAEEWLDIVPKQAFLHFAISILESSRSLASSLRGLTSLGGLSTVQQDKVLSLLRTAAEATDAARQLMEFVYHHNRCDDGSDGRETDTRRELWPRWMYEEYGTAIPYEFFRALAATPFDCSDAYGNADWEAKCYLKGTALVHATNPLQLSQRVSTIASATKALQIAASIQATLAGRGRAGDLGGNLSKGASGQAETLERIPLVVAFSGQTPMSGTDASHASWEPESRTGVFGWVFGPRATLDPQSDEVRLEQTLSNYTLMADLVVPVWWPEVRMNVETGWVGHWQVDAGGDSGPLLGTGRTPRKLRKELPQKRADLDSLTSVLAGEFLGGGTEIRDTEIYAVYPQQFSPCSGEVTLQIYGSNIWRGVVVQLAGLPAKENSIRVLPDMEGISASFELSKLPKGPQLRRPTITVWTQSGFDTWELDLDQNFEANGDCIDTAPSPPIGEVTSVSPSEIQRCVADVTLAIETYGFSVDRAYLGTVEASQIVNGPSPAGSARHVALATFTSPHKGNKDLDTWPLSVLGDNGRVFKSSIAVKGDGCKEAKEPKKPDFSVSPDRVSLCSSSVTLVVTTSVFEIENAYLGAVSGKVEVPIEGDKNQRAYRIEFREPAKGNEAMTTWPLTLVAKSGRAYAGSVSAEGTAKDCEPPPAAKPALRVALPGGGALNVCVKQESLTVFGKGAGGITSAELFGVNATSIDKLSEETVVLGFNPPLFKDDKGLEDSTKLRLTVGAKELALEIPLRCNK